MTLHVRRASRALLAVVLLALSTTIVSVAAEPAPPIAHAAGGFTGLAPARLWDTRSGPGVVTADGTNVGTGPLRAGQTYRLQVAGRGGVPATGATAIVANVTAIAPTEPSFLTVFPAGASRPNASNLNTDAGRTLPNMVIVPLSGGAIDVFNAAGSTDVAVDVLGWFDGSGGFTGLTPARLWETRSGPGLATTDGQALGTGRLGPDATFRLKVTGRGGVPPTGVGAVALNVTAIAPNEPSFITVHPAGIARPNASNLNTAPDRTLPNMVIVPVPASGEIDVYNAAGTTDVAVDVLGWFPGGAGALQPLNPSRLWDTRNGPGISTTDGLQLGTGRLGAGAAFSVQVTGRAQVPATGVSAVALNVTAIGPDAGSFVTVYPSGTTRPTASNLNTAPGRTLPNMVIVPVSADGKVDVFNFAGTTDVAVDVLGWFPGTTGGVPPVDAGRLYYDGVTEIFNFDLAQLVERAGPEVLDRDTDFAVNATATEFTYAIDDFPNQQVVIADVTTGDQKATFTMPRVSEPWSQIYPSYDDQRYASIVSDPNDTFGPSQLVVFQRSGALSGFIDNVRAFQWAPNGDWVIIANNAGVWSLMVVPLTGPAWVVATFNRAYDDLPTDIGVSPDRSTIVYADQAALYSVPYAGGATPRRIVESNATLGEPSFSPDGLFLALSRDGDSGFLLKCDGIYVVPVLTAGAPIYLIGGDADPFKLKTFSGSRITSCGAGMRWV